MIPLETEFYAHGFVHKLLRRAGFAAIYARFRRSDPEKVIHYEVVLITPGKPYDIAGKAFPAKEQYPSSQQWGARGWTYRSEEQALARFNSLVAIEARTPVRQFSRCASR